MRFCRSACSSRLSAFGCGRGRRTGSEERLGSFAGLAQPGHRLVAALDQIQQFSHQPIRLVQPSEAERAIQAWLGQAAERPDLGWTRAELETHVRDEHSTFSWLLEPMLVRAGFEIRTVDHDASQIYSTFVCVKR